MESSAENNLLNEAYNSLLRINLEIIRPTVPDGRLYHYTSAEGLRGIVESKCLHASLAYLLNDSSEVLYGCDIVLSAIPQLKDAYSGRTTTLVSRVLDDLNASFSFESNRPTWTHSIFVACFCASDNLLSQWRAYGQQGGYSLGIAASPSPNLQPEPKTFTARLIRVEYNRQTQIQSCLQLLRDILSKISSEDLAIAVANQSQYSFHKYEKFYTVIQDLLIEKIVGFKNPAFAEEREWRLVARQRELMKQGIDDGGKSPTEVYFRTSRGLVIPYIKLVPRQGPQIPGQAPFLLSSIRFGPTLNRSKGEASLRMMLEMNDIKNVVIDGSDIPVLL